MIHGGAWGPVSADGLGPAESSRLRRAHTAEADPNIHFLDFLFYLLTIVSRCHGFLHPENIKQYLWTRTNNSNSWVIIVNCHLGVVYRLSNYNVLNKILTQPKDEVKLRCEYINKR